MMDLVIIILAMMQPNEVNSISFHHSSLQILHHSPYELYDMTYEWNGFWLPFRN